MSGFDYHEGEELLDVVLEDGRMIRFYGVPPEEVASFREAAAPVRYLRRRIEPTYLHKQLR